MKKIIIVLPFLLIASFFSNAQNSTAYAYYSALCNLNGKTAFIFTSPKAFSYPKGSTYLFAPPQYESISKKTVEKAGKAIDPSWNGLYVNQLIEHATSTPTNYNNALQEVKNELTRIYKDQQSQTNRTGTFDFKIVDMETGNEILSYSLAPNTTNSKNGSQGNAY